jgi:hypothetical protein
MTAILENIYGRLAAEKYRFTESEFSEQYLGKCSSYFAHLKSTGKQVSIDALWKLWSTLNIEHEMCLYDISNAKREFQRQMLAEAAELFRDLREEVFTELRERACAVRK